MPRSAATLVILGLIGGLAAPAAAQEGPGIDLHSRGTFGPVGPPTFAPGSEDCPGGEAYDDGVPENGYSGNPALVSSVEIVQLFNPTGSTLTYTGTCVALVTLDEPTLDFEIVVFANAGGTPGAEIGAVPASVTDLPGALPGQWYIFNITSLALTPTEPIFVGTRWNPMTFPSRFLLADETPATPLHTGFANFNGGAGWQATETVFPNFRAQLIRMTTAAPVPSMPPIGLVLAVLLALTVAAWMLRRGRMPAPAA
jgi:hypothetical protein